MLFEPVTFFHQTRVRVGCISQISLVANYVWTVKLFIKLLSILILLFFLIHVHYFSFLSPLLINKNNKETMMRHRIIPRLGTRDVSPPYTG